VPLQLLQSHGSSIEEVFAGKETPKLRGALNQLINEAGGHLKTACALLEGMPPEVRPVFLPLSLLVRDLQRMSRADNDPFVPQVTSRLRILWTLWRASRSPMFGG
jgi:phytoene synthase